MKSTTRLFMIAAAMVASVAHAQPAASAPVEAAHAHDPAPRLQRFRKLLIGAALEFGVPEVQEAVLVLQSEQFLARLLEAADDSGDQETGENPYESAKALEVARAWVNTQWTPFDKLVPISVSLQSEEVGVGEARVRVRATLRYRADGVIITHSNTLLLDTVRWLVKDYR